MFKQILKNLELLLEELRVWWGQRGICGLPRAGGLGSWFWLCMKLYGALSRGTPELERKPSPGGQGERAVTCQSCSEYQPGTLSWSKAATAVTTGSSWSAPCHHPSAVWGPGASCSPQYLSPTCSMAGSNSKLSKFCQWPCLRVPILACLVNI